MTPTRLHDTLLLATGQALVNTHLLVTRVGMPTGGAPSSTSDIQSPAAPYPPAVPPTAV